MYHKILVPIDGSAASDRAIEHAAGLARLAADAAPPPQITVLLVSQPAHVALGGIEAPASGPNGLPEAMRTEIDRAIREADDAMLARAAGIVRARGVPAGVRRVEGGSPALAIASEAAEGGYDLIVMGSRGLGQQDTATDLLGSVTERVLRRVACPVLVVRQSAQARQP
jgi:nucleotide-binding universal stress UspA family protein